MSCQLFITHTSQLADGEVRLRRRSRRVEKYVRCLLLPQLFPGLLHSRHEMSALLRLIRALQPKISDRTEGDESADSAANDTCTFSIEWRDTSSCLARHCA